MAGAYAASAPGATPLPEANGLARFHVPAGSFEEGHVGRALHALEMPGYPASHSRIRMLERGIVPLCSLLAGLLAPAVRPLLVDIFLLTLAWVIFCATTFLRAGHNFIRGGEMSPLRFTLVLLRYIAGQAATVIRGIVVTTFKRLRKPKPIVFDRTPKKGA